MTALCTCPRPVQDTLRHDPPRCVTCRGIIVLAEPLSEPRFARLVDDMVSILGRIAADHLPVVVDLAASPVRRRDPAAGGGHSSGGSDPTGDAAVDQRCQTVRAHYALAGAYLARAAAQLRLADEQMGDALYAADPGPARSTGEWWPQITSQHDLDQQRAYQAKRRRNGEP